VQDFAFHYPKALRELRKTQYAMSGRELDKLPAFVTTVLRDVSDSGHLEEDVDVEVNTFVRLFSGVCRLKPTPYMWYPQEGGRGGGPRRGGKWKARVF